MKELCWKESISREWSGSCFDSSSCEGKENPKAAIGTKTSATRSPPDHHSVIISWIFLIVRTSEDQHQSEFKRKTEKSRKKLGQKTVKRRRFKALDVWTETDTARVIGTRVLTEQHQRGATNIEKKKWDLVNNNNFKKAVTSTDAATFRKAIPNPEANGRRRSRISVVISLPPRDT